MGRCAFRLGCSAFGQVNGLKRIVLNLECTSQCAQTHNTVLNTLTCNVVGVIVVYCSTNSALAVHACV